MYGCYGCRCQAIVKASPSASQGPVPASRGQNSEVSVKWVRDVLCYCVCNTCDGLVIELLEAACGSSCYLGSGVGGVCELGLVREHA